ncbi:protein-L-isoaspartate(D-aspartate) O-methyltransferase [Rickettsiaceae bacterium]|jgi:protein-L-isoaspartate(D-aspartate) O-methyltransferase|nr:protein-L-isoaspartate(D-aspartate) O-methyltransferase [Rickettsiaceae bacterium]
MERGKIKFYDSSKGYGFIYPEGNGEDIFIHRSELFVDQAWRHSSYTDSPLPIACGQTISQPYIVAFMTEVAQLDKEAKVLEIGTGSGCQAAILAKICKEVYTIERVQELAESAKNRLKELGYNNVHVKTGDGYKGWSSTAPFDAIIVTAASTEIPQELIKQYKGQLHE